MPEPPSRSAGHAQFDALCAELGEYEPLPKSQPWTVPEPDRQATFDGETIDEEILARLVSP